MADHSIKGKTVLIAGGAKNLGGLIARDLAREGARAVAIHYNSAASKADADKTLAAISAAGAKAVAFQADLIILAIGENVPGLKTAEEKAQFQEAVARLLATLQGTHKPTILVRSCFWADAAKDQALRRACAAVGGVFVNISALGKDEKNYARSERPFKHAGVANHPGDAGMAAIADALMTALPE